MMRTVQGDMTKLAVDAIVKNVENKKKGADACR